MEPLSLAPPEIASDNLVDQPITLAAPEVSVAPSEKIVQQKVAQAEQALGPDSSVTKQNLYDYISSGREEAMRATIASQNNMRNSTDKVERIKSMLMNGASLRDIEWETKARPEIPYTNLDVFERLAGEQSMKALDEYSKTNPSNAWQETSDAIPKTDLDLLRQGTSLNFARWRYLANKIQEAGDVRDQQTFVGKALDMGKVMFPIFNPYEELKARGNVPGSEGGFFLGENKKAQYEKLWSLPYEQFISNVDNIYKGLVKDNPTYAIMFLKDMMGMTSTEKALGNLNTIGHISDVASVGAGAYKLAKTAYQLKQVKDTLTNLMVSAKTLDATKADILANIGDLNTAALEDASKMFTSRIKGETTVTAEGMEMLGRFWKIDRQNIAKDASLSETQRNILITEIDRREGAMLQALTKMARPDAFPLQKATSEIAKEIAEDAVHKYPGIKNAILHIADPVREPLSNSWNVTAWVGKKTGQFFEDLPEAIGYARNHGLKVTLDKDQLNLITSRMKDIKDELKHGPDMDSDTAGLNRFYSLETELKDLKAIHDETGQAGGYLIKTHSLGHYIELNSTVPQNTRLANAIFNAKQRPADLSLPSGLGNSLPWWPFARTAEDTVSAEERAARKAAIYPQGILRALMAEEAKQIMDVSKGTVRWDPVTGAKIPAWQRIYAPFASKALHRKEWSDFRDTLKYSQDKLDADGIPGSYFKNNEELTQHYLDNFNRTPNWAETEAYFAVKRWNEMDRMLREVSLFRNKAIAGAESYRIITKKGEEKVYSPSFDAVSLDYFPSGSGRVAIVDDAWDSARARDLTHMKLAEKDEWHQAVKEGRYRMLQPYDPEKKPLGGINFKDKPEHADTYFDYILVRNVEQRPLTWEQVPYRGGGHQVYDYPNFIKQPSIKSEKVDGYTVHGYEGDTSLMPIRHKTMGEDVARKFSTVRQLLAAGKKEEAKAFVERSHLGFSWQDVSEMFHGKRMADGTVVPPRFNLKEDFYVVPRNKSLIDLEKGIESRYGANTVNGGVFEDRTRRGLARNFQVEYTGERDARGIFTVENIGTVDNPHYNLRPAEKVSPLEVLNRSSNKIVNSTFMDDYKMYAVRTWLEQAKPYLKASDSDIDYSPFYHFNTATDDSFRSGFREKNPLLMQQLLANKFKVEQLVGKPTTLQSFMHSWSEAMADSLYGKTGKSVPIWLIDKVKDPSAFLRTVAFNAKLGLFAVDQLFVQMATYVNIFAHSPRYATSGTIASLLHLWSGLNETPAILKALDKIAVNGSKLPGMIHWKPGEWMEARQAMRDSGFHRVGEEYAALDRIHSNKLIKGGFGEFLDWGQLPFKGGEKSSRIGAWFTAFKEFREANPFAKLDRGNMQKVIDRADFLAGNMSSASNSVLHTGVLSLPTQFFSYTIRLAEQFWSKRIGATPMERTLVRARLLATNAAMFGVPMAGGISGLPVADYLRRKAIENGYTVNRTNDPNASARDWVEHAVMNGIPSMLTAMATGENYNYASRYGSKGFTTFSDALFGDAPFWQIAGASPKLMINTFGPNKAGLVQAMTSIMTGDAFQDIPEYTPKGQDFLDFFKEIRTLPRSQQLVGALKSGAWYASNDKFVKDVTWQSAFAMYMFGLSPQEQEDKRLMDVNHNDEVETRKEAIRRVTQEVDRFIKAKAEGNENQAWEYIRRAKTAAVWGGLDNKQTANAIASALKDKGNLIERGAYKNLLQGTKQDNLSKNRKMYQDIMNAQRGRN